MPHSGHRERMRRKIRFGYVEDHELLETLLYYSIPRINTNELAHALLRRFGSLDAVFNADELSLQSVQGIGENSAFLIKLVGLIMNRCMRSRSDSRYLLSSFSELSRYLTSLFISCSHEKTYLLLFNPSNRLVACESVGEGTPTYSPLLMRKILDLALYHNAASALLAHNHPDGLVVASEEDIRTTERIQATLTELGIRFVDHYIVTPDSCIPILHKELSEPKKDNKESN